MNIYAKKGEKVKYTGKNGRDSDRILANQYLKIGKVYTVNKTFVHQYISYVELKEFPSQQFNTVHFDDYKIKSESLLEVRCFSNYEYEMFFKSDPNDVCKIDGWYPIATDRIKNIDKVEEYISSGLLRRVSYTCQSQNNESLLDILTGLRNQFEQMGNDKHASDYIKHWCYLRVNEINNAIKKAENKHE